MNPTPELTDQVMLLALDSSPEIVAFMLNHYVEMDEWKYMGKSCLVEAVRRERADLVEMLLSRKFDLMKHQVFQS